MTAHDYCRPGKPECTWDDPVARGTLVSALVNDALAILAAVDGIDLNERQAGAVGLLALVAGQDVEPGGGPGSWRIARGTVKDKALRGGAILQSPALMSIHLPGQARPHDAPARK